MAHQHPPTLHPEKLDIGPVAARLGIPALLVGIFALILAAWFGLRSDDLKNVLLHAYLTAFCFFLVITLGSIFFVLIHHATRAAWSVTVRRLAEGLSQNILLLVVLFIPILAYAPRLLEWLNAGIVDEDPILHAKAGYMNPTFLYIRLAAYFVIWLFAARFFAARSIRQDQTADPAITTRLEYLSYPMLILMGFSLTGFAFDWIMGLNPHWFSTIFGVYIFGGAMLSAFASITLLALSLQKRGRIGAVVNHDHYHDLGKWMFAFTVFWAYIGFAQYMLIWYSNIPEETQFFIPRQIGHWGSISLLLLAVHFVIPFPGLLSRHVKRRNAVVAFWAVWSLLACALDMFWLIMPNTWIRQIPDEVAGTSGTRLNLVESLSSFVNGTHDLHNLAPAHKAFYSQVDLPLTPLPLLITALCFIGIGGLYIFWTMFALKGKSLVPTHDPRLDESLAFENV
jgi:hypothetical protein